MRILYFCTSVARQPRMDRFSRSPANLLDSLHAVDAGSHTARPILRIPCMRRKKISAHFALSSRRLKVAVV
eukprot:COSAG01_NODE_42552_length_438_cov_587.265487_1_plen_70_part_10